MKTYFKTGLGIMAVVLAAMFLSRLDSGARSVQPPVSTSEDSFASLTPAVLLAEKIPNTANAEQVRRGQYLVAAGDCMACHLRPGGAPFAGGLPMVTPFGTIYTSNITSDPDTGIGGWTNEQFYRAMHQGIGAQGENLYPAFPYPWFARVTRSDTDAILAYLKTTPAVRYTPPGNELRFPMNLRVSVKAWNLLYLKADEFKPDPGQSAEWNRGAYLVTGLGHCSGCHTPKGRLGADLEAESFRGSQLENSVAPDLTPNPHNGLGQWGLEEVARYLQTGRNEHSAAAGLMGEVVTYSTSLLTHADNLAIATYLRSLAPSPRGQSESPAPDSMKRGAEIYSDVCTACHLENGVGQPGYFPPLKGNALLQQADPTGLEHLILAGGRTGPTSERPSPLTMSSFAWKLTDQEIADVSTYVRNSWGNQASPVTASQVAQLRHALGLETRRPTANSGDWQ
jgi:mono/diheme cytochrome c family protein